MLISTEDVTQKSEGADFARDNPQLFSGSGLNIHPHMKVRKIEAVTAILTLEFEYNGHVLFESNFTRLEFER